MSEAENAVEGASEVQRQVSPPRPQPTTRDYGATRKSFISFFISASGRRSRKGNASQDESATATGEAMTEEEERKAKWGTALNDWRKKSGLTCSFVIFTALNIAMMTIGIMGLHRCPIQKMVPIYLIVAGSTSLSLLLVRLIVGSYLLPALERNIISQVVREEEQLVTKQEREEECDEDARIVCLWCTLKVYDSIASIFSTVWLIVGSVFVFKVHPNYDDPNSPDYCWYDEYIFAYVVIIIGYISLGLSLLAVICHFCCIR